MEVIVKTPITLDYIQKLLIALYGTTNVQFKNGNINDIRSSNIKIKYTPMTLNSIEQIKV